MHRRRPERRNIATASGRAHRLDLYLPPASRRKPNNSLLHLRGVMNVSYRPVVGRHHCRHLVSRRVRRASAGGRVAPLAGRIGIRPILLRRTPYGVPAKAFIAIPDHLKALAGDGYIFVIQNIRGRFKSEGTFSLSEDSSVTAGEGTIETRDAWDTVDWLIKNVP